MYIFLQKYNNNKIIKYKKSQPKQLLYNIDFEKYLRTRNKRYILFKLSK